MCIRDSTWRGFLKYFKKCVGGVAVHCVYGIDDDDLQAGTMRPDVEEIIEGTYLIDGYLLTGLLSALFHACFFGHRLRLKKPKIRVVFLLEPVAGEASAAEVSAIQRLFAEQAFREGTGQRKFPQAALADKQQRMRQSFALRLQAGPGSRMESNNVHK